MELCGLHSTLLYAINVQYGTSNFTSLTKKVVLYIYPLKKPLTLARFEPTNLGSTGDVYH
jgi:hypothetical protein